MHSSVEHKEEHNSVHIYTGSSEMEDQLGFTAVLPSKTLNGGLPSAASIFTADMCEIKTLVEEPLEIWAM